MRFGHVSTYAFRQTPWGHPSLLHPAIGIQCDDDLKGFLGEWRQWRRALYMDPVPKPRWPSISVAPLLWSSLQRHHCRHRRCMLLANLLPSCVNTVEEDGADLAACCV